MMQDQDNGSNPTWGKRLAQGARVLLPICFFDHWILVVLSPSRQRVNMRIFDSMHSEYEVYHKSFVHVVARVCQVMGRFDDSFTITHVQSTTPLEQRLSLNFCAFHVLIRVWMYASRQVDTKITYGDIETIRKYVQYMLLSRSL